FCARGAY
nr:immunoglobulin heavy chain junction region [Mus musculus]